MYIIHLMNINLILEGRELFLGYGGTINNQRLLGKTIEIAENMLFSFNQVSIEINGKKLCVKKASFISHLHSLSFNKNDIPEIQKLGYDRFLMKNPKVFDPDKNNSLLSVLPDSAREAAFRRMIMAIQENNIEIAARELEKGAWLDKRFFVVRGTIAFEQGDISKEIRNEARINGGSIIVPVTYRHTPLTFALLHKCQSLANRIFTMKGNDCLSDYMYLLNIDKILLDYPVIMPADSTPSFLIQNQKVFVNEDGLPQLVPMTNEETRHIPYG